MPNGMQTKVSHNTTGVVAKWLRCRVSNFVGSTSIGLNPFACTTNHKPAATSLPTTDHRHPGTLQSNAPRNGYISSHYGFRFARQGSINSATAIPNNAATLQ